MDKELSRIFAQLVSLKLGGNKPSLIHRCQILSPIQQSSSALVPVAPIKGLASMRFSILQPMLLLCGHTSAE